MRVQYIEVEGESREIKGNKESYYYKNIYVQIGEKVKLGSTLCEVVDIVHYPAINEENYQVDVLVKVIKKLPKSILGDINLFDLLDFFKKK